MFGNKYNHTTYKHIYACVYNIIYCLISKHLLSYYLLVIIRKLLTDHSQKSDVINIHGLYYFQFIHHIANRRSGQAHCIVGCSIPLSKICKLHI